MPIFAMIGKAILFPIKFIREVQLELKQVTWPSRKDTVSLTGIVIVFSILVGGWIGFLDFVFTKGTTFIFR